MRRLSIILITILLARSAVAQDLLRGPYLQSPTPHGITIKWRTAYNSSSILWLGNHPDSLILHASAPANVAEHTVQVDDLDAGTTYYYAIGSVHGMLAGPGEAYRFRTLPSPGSDQPLRIWATGDMGRGNEGQLAVKDAYLAHPGSADTDMWIWLGDNVYDEGKDSEYQSKLFGFSGYNDLFSWMPFYPAPGNHDYVEVWRQSTLFGIPYSNIPLEDHQGPYFDIVHVPQAGEAGGRPSTLEVFYSFDLGNAHFISLNSEVYDLLGTSNGIDRMVEWLQLDLAENEKLFTIAYFHQPPYSKGSHDSDNIVERVMKAMRERVVPALEAFDVDLVLSGHSHVFERSHLIHGHYGNSDTFDPSTMLRDGSGGDLASGSPYIKDALPGTPDGTVYVVCGNSAAWDSGTGLDHPVMAYSDGGGDALGSFLIDIEGGRLDGSYLKADGTIGDHFTILKGEQEPVAVGERRPAGEVLVFPNPTQGPLNIRLGGATASAELRLLDASGRVVRARSLNGPRHVLDLEDLGRGQYLLVVQVAGERTVRRVSLY